MIAFTCLHIYTFFLTLVWNWVLSICIKDTLKLTLHGFKTKTSTVLVLFLVWVALVSVINWRSAGQAKLTDADGMKNVKISAESRLFASDQRNVIDLPVTKWSLKTTWAPLIKLKPRWPAHQLIADGNGRCCNWAVLLVCSFLNWRMAG